MRPATAKTCGMSCEIGTPITKAAIGFVIGVLPGMKQYALPSGAIRLQLAERLHRQPNMSCSDRRRDTAPDVTFPMEECKDSR